jgi:superfamily II DNA helicase RecQ
MWQEVSVVEGIGHVRETTGESGRYAASVLKCVDSIPFRVGKTKLARVLRGSGSRDILRMDLARIPLYGELRMLTIQQIVAVIDQLVNAGYLRSSFGRRPVLTLTREGRAAMLSGNVPQVDAPDAVAMFIARERCRRCPYNPSMIGSGASLVTSGRAVD